jgi:uncharacterized membrane protein (UPF0136 family)
MFGIAHADFGWMISGLIVFIGLIFFVSKLIRGQILGLVLSGAVWFFVYTMHSGSTQGIMTATFAALLFDVFGLPILGLVKKL